MRRRKKKLSFRELKKSKFYWYLDEVYFKDKDDEPPYWWDSMPESYVVNDEKGLRAYYHWEDDREYCGSSGYTEEPYTWKELKFTLRHQRKEDKKYNDLHIWNGKCDRCGCTLTSENYKEDKIYDNNQFQFCFERDLYYCNDCKQKQIDDYEKFCMEYHEQHKDESPLYF